jgi:hypothetical protein
MRQYHLYLPTPVRGTGRLPVTAWVLLSAFGWTVLSFAYHWFLG